MYAGVVPGRGRDRCTGTGYDADVLDTEYDADVLGTASASLGENL